MKKILILIFSLLLSVTLIVPTFALEDNNWGEKQADGYQYYQYRNVNANTTISVTAPVEQVLEIEDWDTGVYSELKDVNGKIIKTVSILIAKESSNSNYFSLKIRYGEKVVQYATHADDYNQALSRIKIRKLASVADIPDDQFITVDKLPKTKNNGNFLTDVGHVSFLVEGKTVIVTITYYGTYRIKYTMGDETDMKLFSSREAYYLNIENGPQIFINNSDRLYLKDIMNSKVSNKNTGAFVPHTIWSLETNDLKHINTYDAYTYIKHNDKTALVAYFYTDAFIMENIISANIQFTFRQKSNWFGETLEFFGANNPAKEWTRKTWSYESGQTLEYKDTTFDWQNFIPLWNIYVGIKRGTKTYEMPRIEKVDLNKPQSYYNISKTEVESKFKAVDNNFTTIKDKEGYNLWAFGLMQGKTSDISKLELYNNQENPTDKNNFSVIEIVYETDGKIYTTVQSDMNIKIVPDDSLIPGAKGNFWQENKTGILIVLAVFAFFALQQGVLTNSKRRNDFLKTILIFGAVGLLIYFAITNNWISFITYRL